MKNVGTVAHTCNPKALEADRRIPAALAQPGFTWDQQVRARVTALTGMADSAWWKRGRDRVRRDHQGALLCPCSTLTVGTAAS